MKPKVLYILGYGRSGSTVLGMALGRHPDIVDIGEVVTLPTFVPGPGYMAPRACGCLQPVGQCPFWRGVKQRVGTLGRPEDVQPPTGRGWRHYAPWLPPLNADLERWGQANAAFYAAVLEEAEASVALDASKRAGRAYWLWASEAVDLVVLWLTRRPEDVLRSELRHGNYALKAALSWHVAHRRAAQLVRKIEAAGGGKVLRASFEELTSVPDALLSRLLHELDLPWHDDVLRPCPGHVIGGEHEAKHGGRTTIAAPSGPRAPLPLSSWFIWQIFNNALLAPFPRRGERR